jgi:hypothetical protein
MNEPPNKVQSKDEKKSKNKNEKKKKKEKIDFTKNIPKDLKNKEKLNELLKNIINFEREKLITMENEEHKEKLENLFNKFLKNYSTFMLPKPNEYNDYMESKYQTLQYTLELLKNEEIMLENLSKEFNDKKMEYEKIFNEKSEESKNESEILEKNDNDFLMKNNLEKIIEANAFVVSQLSVFTDSAMNFQRNAEKFISKVNKKLNEEDKMELNDSSVVYKFFN